MSKVTDMWGDIIFIDTGHRSVNITFEDGYGLREDPPFGMALDADQTRKLIKKLKKALDEMEDM